MSIPNSENTCVTTTSMPRPELLEITYKSFQRNMPWLDFKKMTLFLNIDHFPGGHEPEKERENIEKNIAVASCYFDKVISNLGDSSFPKAVKWIFSQANKEFVFNLEDDWELLCNIPEDSVRFFENKEIIQVGYRAWKRNDPRFVLSPSFIRSSFCNFVASKMNDGRNPEEQIRGINPYKKELFIYWPLETDKIILKDLGRTWIKSSCYGRGLDDFVTWKFLPNSITRWREQLCLDQNSDIDLTKLDGNFRRPDVPN